MLWMPRMQTRVCYIDAPEPEPECESESESKNPANLSCPSATSNF